MRYFSLVRKLKNFTHMIHKASVESASFKEKRLIGKQKQMFCVTLHVE